MSGEILRFAAGAGERRRHESAGEDGRRTATVSVAEAALLLGVPVRTFRDWVRAGKVATVPPTPPQRGARVPTAAVDALRGTLDSDQATARAVGLAEGRVEAEDGENRRNALTRDDTRAELRALQERYQILWVESITLKAHSEERGRLLSEVEFLRGQMDRSREAEAQLQALLRETTRALAAAEERLARFEGRNPAPGGA